MPGTSYLNPGWQSQLEPVYRLYAALACSLDPEFGLGGKLLYAGELHEDGSRLMRAANIAGAASLAATVDPEALRRSNRDGVADFLVNSLDEALRILKNEVRKRQAVSVAVSVSPAQIVTEMLERGVQPDLLPPVTWNDGESSLDLVTVQGSRRVEIGPLAEGLVFRAWAATPPEFERLAMAILPQDDHANRRWLRLSPRYLGPLVRRVRSVACTAETAERVNAALAPR